MMKRNIIFDYIFHGIYLTIYGVFKYLPSPIGDIFRYLVLKPVFKKSGRVRIYEGVTIWYPYGISIGRNVTLNEYVYISGYGGVTIGDNVSIGHRCSILSSDHIISDTSKTIKEQGIIGGETIIEEDVFLGCNCTILKGVRIGKGSIIGAGSIVTKNVPEYSIYAGNPARLIKRR